MRKKVAVGLSGGIDSSVAAYLLKEKGYEVIGFTLKFYPQENRCCDLESLYQAQRLCHKLDIPHYVLDAASLFRKEIIGYFVSSYLGGLTPNPCAYCNRLIKFGFFFEKIKSFGVDYLATGHYARLVKKGPNYFLKTGKDRKKSQEYFLSLLEPKVLEWLIFPLGNYTKSEVKQIAQDKEIIFKERKESQDVCFVKGKDYSEFIEENILKKSEYRGDIRHVNGKILGRHKGIYRYTYGQRGGLGISWSKPLYVVDIDRKTKAIIVGEKEFLYRDKFSVHSLNWLNLADDFFSGSKKLKSIKVKVRYRSKGYDCSLKFAENKVMVCLKQKIDSIASGQIAAFYQQDTLLGAGIISRN